MSLFIQVEVEPVVQVNDKTRIDASQSFVTVGAAAVTLVRIKPSADDSYITVDNTDMYLDWVYSTEGDKVVTVEITNGGSPVTKDVSLSVVTEDDDNLFSNDQQLKTHEHDILKWIPPGRSTYKNVHRAAQELILAYLDKEGKTDIYGAKFTKAAFVDITEGRDWSKFMTLRLIFDGISNAIDDIFYKKAREYEKWEVVHRNRVVLRIDTDGDGEVSLAESTEGPRTCRVVRE